MKRQLLIALWILFLPSIMLTQPKHTFEIKNGDFLYDGEPFRILSGEMHYARIPKEYWSHRLQMLRSMGLNTVATYVFWNHHETAPGVWDFKSENRDIRGFIKLAQAEGLKVIIRPGPYACAEWEFGGYPWWLQKNKSLVIRSDNKPFLDSCGIYIDRLVEEIKDLQVTKGGPIILVQAENEFGSYVAQRKDIAVEKHRNYSYAIKERLLRAGVVVPLFTSDGSWLFEGGFIEGALPTANGEDNVARLKEIVDRYNGGTGPYMVAEFYPGWLDHWAEPFQKVKTADVLQQMQKYLDSSVSFNLYMAHGGTNFGFTSGANYDKDHGIQPDLTSYDYDAPVSEAGWATEKYRAIREKLSTYAKYELPPVPSAIPVIAIEPIVMENVYPLDLLKDQMIPVPGDRPMSFEELDQGHGYLLYRRKFVQGVGGELRINGLRDYATVYVDGSRRGVLNRYFNDFSMEIDIPPSATLEILVENMGRINYGAEIVNNLKGIISPVLIDSAEITGGWEMFKFPLGSKPDLAGLPSGNRPGRPAFYRGEFTLRETGDTFLDMRNWGKGIVFLNDHHLGRYWSVGPQQTLYVPGVWLKEGKNEIVIFEQLNDLPQRTVRFLAEPILDELRGK